MNKVAIVTAASQGMGEACVRQLKIRGYDLALISRSDKIDSLANELGAVSFQGDVSNASDLQIFVDTVLNKHYPTGPNLRIDGGITRSK